MARAERGIRERGEERGYERHDEGEPHGIAGLARGLADQPIDAGAEHRAEPVNAICAGPMERTSAGSLPEDDANFVAESSFIARRA